MKQFQTKAEELEALKEEYAYLSATCQLDVVEEEEYYGDIMFLTAEVEEERRPPKCCWEYL